MAVPYAVAAGAGALLWLLTASIAGRREAWDAPLYWTVAYPVGLAIAALLGYTHPERPWRWGLILMLTQAVTLVITTGAGSMLPLGLVLFGFLALPAIVLGNVAGWLRRRTRIA